MPNKKLIFFIVLLLAHATSTKAQNNDNNIKIEGLVYDIHTNHPIGGVNIYDLSNRKGTFTTDKGFFTFHVPKGNVKLKVSIIGYKQTNIDIKPIKRDTLITIYLTESDNTLDNVTVVANRSGNKVLSSQMGALSLGQQGIKNIPTVFGEADIIKALQTQPGVSAGIEGFAGMYVRGGNNDENLLMIDEHPLYQVNHLGGLFSPFNIETVDNITFYKSSFPARYGGRLSSVMNVRTKNGNMEEYHGSATIGLTSMNLTFEGPIIQNKTSFIASVRRSWLELLSVPALAISNAKEKKSGRKVIGGYSFMDANFKLNHKFNDKSHAYLTFYYGSDYLKIGEHKFSNSEDEFYRNEDVNKLKWGNILTATGWNYQFNEKLNLELAASYTHYTSNLNQSVLDRWGNTQSGRLEEDYIKKTVENGIDDVSFRANINYYPNDKHHINFGIEYTNHSFLPESTKNIASDTLIHTNGINSKEKINANEWGAYIEDDWKICTTLQVKAGLRLGSFIVQNKSFTNLEPRITARVLLSPVLSFKSSYSRMNQYVQQISDNYISLPTDFWMPINRNFSPLISDQVSAGLYFNYKDDYTVSIEGYYKWMKNLLEYKDGYNLLPSTASWEEKLTSGKGTAYGVDLLLEKNTGKLKGSIGYGLMWTDRLFSELNKGEHFPSKYDNRHKINIAATYPIGRNIDLNCSWMYMTGNRITLSLENYQDLGSSGFPSDIAPSYPYEDEWGIGYYDKKNNIRLPAYHRLDVGINIYKPKKNNRLGIWNISLYNAYSKMNPIVIQKSSLKTNMAGEKVKPKFQSLSIFPIIPSVSYTYKF